VGEPGKAGIGVVQPKHRYDTEEGGNGDHDCQLSATMRTEGPGRDYGCAESKNRCSDPGAHRATYGARLHTWESQSQALPHCVSRRGLAPRGGVLVEREQWVSLQGPCD
jgi:hypothetical protein